MKITEKELTAIQEICSIEEINAKNLELYATMLPPEETDLAKMFLNESNRYRKNIQRLMKYVK